MFATTTDDVRAQADQARRAYEHDERIVTELRRRLRLAESALTQSRSVMLAHERMLRAREAVDGAQTGPVPLVAAQVRDEVDVLLELQRVTGWGVLDLADSRAQL